MIIGLVTAVAASACYGTGWVLQAVGSRRSARREIAAGSTTATTTTVAGAVAVARFGAAEHAIGEAARPEEAVHSP